jgi:hypothetical protein
MQYFHLISISTASILSLFSGCTNMHVKDSQMKVSVTKEEVELIGPFGLLNPLTHFLNHMGEETEAEKELMWNESDDQFSKGKQKDSMKREA